jgi:hypothetical protein
LNFSIQAFLFIEIIDLTCLHLEYNCSRKVVFTHFRKMKRMIYLDHAVTSWPKPPQAAEARGRFMEEVGANPGRSGHLLSIEAPQIGNPCLLQAGAGRNLVTGS